MRVQVKGWKWGEFLGQLKKGGERRKNLGKGGETRRENTDRGQKGESQKQGRKEKRSCRGSARGAVPRERRAG